jgi:NodT family efflux transporter outer membrane factor (OMF) lipoprotein
MRVLALFTCLSAAILEAGCVVGSDYHDPVPAGVPARWAGAAPDASSRISDGDVDSTWWRSFRDPELSSLVDRLAVQNLDLKSAAERVMQSVAQRQIAVSQGLPHIEGQSVNTYNRASENGTLSLLTPAPGAPLAYGFFSEGLTSAWELDLFGRVRRAVEAANAATSAAIEDRHAIALASTAELAQTYMQLRGVQVRLAIAARNLKLAEENEGLVETRLGNGVATTLDLAQAKAQRATIAATLPPLRTEEVELTNSIGLLLGEPPRALEGELGPKAIPQVPRHVAVGLPGNLIRRRPDVREAEARLHEATAQTGVAIANFYPDVTLNGNLDAESLHLANLFSPGSVTFAVGPSISIPIFEGGRLHGTLTLRESQQREAAITFQKTVLLAWKEVDDAITAYAQAWRRRAAIEKAVAQNKIALDAAKQRYIEGEIDFLNVNSTQSQLLESENELADTDTEIATDLVALYRALGGGWPISDAIVIAGPFPR